jgi:hypothetical protein
MVYWHSPAKEYTLYAFPFVTGALERAREQIRLLYIDTHSPPVPAGYDRYGPDLMYGLSAIGPYVLPATAVFGLYRILLTTLRNEAFLECDVAPDGRVHLYLHELLPNVGRLPMPSVYASAG